ncbi:MAG: TlpA family protein disulfide reductase [Phycisphaerales bacterium]|nr:MAG: TlpA family protein disulfide reductase [Phycisphaerales bacterium]
MKYCLLLCLPLIAAPVSAAQIKVVDNTGTEVEHCEMMWHTADSGYCRWQAGDGKFSDRPSYNADVVDVLVRADGYATAVRRFSGDSLADFRAGRATITLQRGEEVRLKLNVPDGMNVPDDFLPQMYFPQFAWRVRGMWQPVNLRDRRDKPDFNMLNVSRISDGLYSFRLPRERTPFLVAFQHPGWLQFYEVGPLSNLAVRDGVLEIDVPRPVTIEVTLDTGNVNAARLPFKDALINIHWPNPKTDGSFYSTTWNERITPGQTRAFSDLGPGSYSVEVRTKARDGVENVAGTEINPGRFFARRKIPILPAGTTYIERILWTPFDPNAYRGDCNVRLKLLKVDGRPAAGLPVKVQWYDGHYGSLKIHDGRTPGNGIIRLTGVSSEVVTDSSSGPYWVYLDGEYIDSFRLRPTTDVQEFELRMAPKAGDPAPEIDILDVETGKTQKLSDYHGRVVLLEFWATWCGPCQPAMKKLNKLVNESPDWAGRVVIIPLSVDKTPELAAAHAADRGWTALRHFWSRRVDEGQSQAEQAFVVRGIPTAVLLGPDGRIVWRGHPIAKYSGGIDLRDRIKAVLDEK